jgi:hypothetical protein
MKPSTAQRIYNQAMSRAASGATVAIPFHIRRSMESRFDKLEFRFGWGWIKPVCRDFYMKGVTDLYRSGLMVPVDTHIKSKGGS